MSRTSFNLIKFHTLFFFFYFLPKSPRSTPRFPLTRNPSLPENRKDCSRLFCRSAEFQSRIFFSFPRIRHGHGRSSVVTRASGRNRRTSRRTTSYPGHRFIFQVFITGLINEASKRKYQSPLFISRNSISTSERNFNRAWIVRLDTK